VKEIAFLVGYSPSRVYPVPFEVHFAVRLVNTAVEAPANYVDTAAETERTDVVSTRIRVTSLAGASTAVFTRRTAKCTSKGTG